MHNLQLYAARSGCSCRSPLPRANAMIKHGAIALFRHRANWQSPCGPLVQLNPAAAGAGSMTLFLQPIPSLSEQLVIDQ